MRIQVPRQPHPVCLFCGLLAPDAAWLARGAAALSDVYGAIAARSAAFPFTFTDYYAAEMGAPLWRQFVTLVTPVDPGQLPEIKHRTIAIETDLADGGRRRVNLDPGYLTPAKLVLASTKDFHHRIYLRAGIHAELTLAFDQHGCVFYPWTYADYRSPAATTFLLAERARLKL